MNSLILQTASRFLITLMLLYSVFLLVRGHNYPGGGFVGGLVAAAAWSLYGIAFESKVMREGLKFNPKILIGIGLIIAISSGLPGLFDGSPFMTGQWISIPVHPSTPELPLGRTVEIGTPLLFDMGVYLIVFGSIVTIVMNIEEEGT